jgi:hypothetical protein
MLKNKFLNKGYVEIGTQKSLYLNQKKEIYKQSRLII